MDEYVKAAIRVIEEITITATTTITIIISIITP